MISFEALDGTSVVIGVLLGAAVVLIWWAATSTWDRTTAPQPTRAVSSNRKAGRR